MFKPFLPAIKKSPFLVVVVLAAALSYCFKYSLTEEEWLIWTNKCLAQVYDPSADTKLKKWEISITGDYFIRIRKTYAKGKQEYYSFNLHKLNDMDYMGSTSGGALLLKTQADDIIVQTRNDRNGDVDSMATILNIPVKSIEPERLDSLREAFNYFKGKGM